MTMKHPNQRTIVKFWVEKGIHKNVSLAYIHKCFCTAIANNKMVVIKVANALLHSAQQGYEKTSVHMEELRKVRVSIGSKRRKAKAQLV